MNQHMNEKLKDFFQHYTHKEFTQGEIMLRAEENPSEVIYLYDGVVRQYCISPEGEELTVNLFKPISFFPLMYIVNEIPNRYYFEALTHVKTWKAPKEEVVQFLTQHNDVLYDLLRRVYSGMDALLARMEYILIGNSQTKVIFTLLNAAYRFGSSEGTGIHISLKMTHKDLATLSGMARETFSREIKKLEKKGLITIKDHTITISSMQKLQEALIES